MESSQLKAPVSSVDSPKLQLRSLSSYSPKNLNLPDVIKYSIVKDLVAKVPTNNFLIKAMKKRKPLGAEEGRPNCKKEKGAFLAAKAFFFLIALKSPQMNSSSEFNSPLLLINKYSLLYFLKVLGSITRDLTPEKNF